MIKDYQPSDLYIYEKERIMPKLEYDCDGNIVYKIEGDVNGNIEVDGKNVIILLMNGDIKGNVNLTGSDNNVVVIKGGISGNVKADKVVCPEKPNSDTTSFPPPKRIYKCNKRMYAWRTIAMLTYVKKMIGEKSDEEILNVINRYIRFTDTLDD